MNATTIRDLEADLWEAADQLRSNSKLTATQYSMPVLGLIFLRHAYNRFVKVKEEVEASLPFVEGRGRMPVTKEHFKEKKAIFLAEKAQFKYLADLKDADDRGQALNDAMVEIENEYQKLEGVLPKEFNKFSNDLLGKLLRIFDRESIANAEGDVFGRIYEFFLNKFAISGAQEGGEFFTPPSLVNMIVKVIEPNRGKIFDPACGSAGMFIQTAHFLEKEGKNPTEAITIIGQEKTEVNTRIGKMNLAVHGLEGTIFEGNTFYDDKHNALGQCDFVMANPPFNVDGVDKTKIKTDKRISFKIPKNDNANYLWIQYFYSYLNPTGRSGFVMASSAADAGHTEKEIRKELVNTGAVDVMMSITNNFFYTRSLPCTLWFFDRNKEVDKIKKDQVLMLDARNVYRKVNTTLNDFTPEQLENLTCIVALYRGQNERLTKLVAQYLQTLKGKTEETAKELTALMGGLDFFLNSIQSVIGEDEFTETATVKAALKVETPSKTDLEKMVTTATAQLKTYTKQLAKIPNNNADQRKSVEAFTEAATAIKAIQKPVNQYHRQLKTQIEAAEKSADLRKNKEWKTLKISNAWKVLKSQREKTLEILKETLYFYQECIWLQSRFPEGIYADVEGLCKITQRAEIAENDYSLNPGRYVGVAPQIDEDFDYETRMGEIKTELAGLNKSAFQLGKVIQGHLNDLGI